MSLTPTASAVLAAARNEMPCELCLRWWYLVGGRPVAHFKLRVAHCYCSCCSEILSEGWVFRGRREGSSHIVCCECAKQVMGT